MAVDDQETQSIVAETPEPEVLVTPGPSGLSRQTRIRQERRRQREATTDTDSADEDFQPVKMRRLSDEYRTSSPKRVTRSKSVQVQMSSATVTASKPKRRRSDEANIAMLEPSTSGTTPATSETTSAAKSQTKETASEPNTQRKN